MDRLEPALAALVTSRVIVHQNNFFLARVGVEAFRDREAGWAEKLLASGKPFFFFRDVDEITLVFDEGRFDEIVARLHGVRAEKGWRLVTFSVELDMTLVGFFALVGQILAEANVSILALSSFSRDHLLIKQKDLDTAVTALRPFVEGIEF